jgi:MSHA biogenesis protein MshQ
MLQRGWLVIAALLLAMSGAAAAASVSFSGGAVSNCKLSGNTYTCSAIPLNSDDSAVIASGYTVVLNGSFAPSYNQGLSMSGSAALQTTGGGNIDLSGSNNINISGGTLNAGGNFKLGASTQSITANVNAATITTAGSSTSITGAVSASGAINFGSNTTIKGAVSAASISTGSSTSISGALSVSGLADLGSAITVSGGVSANAVKTGSPAQISGGIVATTTIDLGSGTTVSGNLSGTAITSTSAVTITGNVTGTSFQLASGSAVTGNIKAPSVLLDASNASVKGDIEATTSLDIGSGGTVNGTVKTGTLTMRASNAIINGNATATVDVDMGSGTVINGNLVARNVNTRASNAVINGNAAVNAIYIDWGNSVTKTITCTGPGAALCSCVTKADPNYLPTCGAAPATGPDHIMITHGGSALTCQPQAVTLTACANAACTAPHYNGSVNVTLQPGGASYTISSGTNNAASVQQSSAGVTRMTAASNLATGVTQCRNTATNTTNSSTACDISFDDKGMVITAPDHVSMTTGVNLLVQALQAQGNLPGCVALLKGQQNVNFSCNYQNPGANNNANAKVTLGSTAVSCGATTAVPLTFDANGLASTSLQYPEAGTVNLSASFSGSGFSAKGSDPFTAAPASFKISATRVAGTGNVNGKAFARASELFDLKLEALNAKGDVTTNFGKEDSAENFKPSYVLKAPATHDGMLTTDFGAVSGGNSTTVKPWRFDDTGTVTLSVKLANGSGNYMGNNSSGFDTHGTLDLLFIPDHFDTVLTGAAPMGCAQLPANPCGTLNASGSFVYSRQPFDLLVYAYIGAKDSSGAYLSPQNYVGDGATAITLSAWDGAGSGTQIPTGAASGGNFSWSGEAASPVPGRFAFSYDTASKRTAGKLAAANLPSFNFFNMPPSATAVAPTTLFVRAIDANLATSQRSGAGETALTVVTGRLDVSNNHGSFSGAVPVQLNAQYFNGSVYVFNPQFGLRTPATSPTVSFTIGSNIGFSNCQGFSSAANTACPSFTVASPATVQFKNGSGTFRLNQPSPAAVVKGAVNVLMQQPGSATPWIPYLPSFAPAGRLTFGIYPSGPVIYTREVYN